MSRYKVWASSVDVEGYSLTADSVEIEEGGVLAFYETPGGGETLQSVAGGDELVEAYAEWDRFEEA